MKARLIRELMGYTAIVVLSNARVRMAGRRVFFSFHYREDVWRASNVRNSGNFDAVSAAGWKDASLWEATKREGDAAIRRIIDDGLKNTSVTVVLIGSNTAQRRWVTYEIEQSMARSNGIFGVRIHRMKDQLGKRSTRGTTPTALAEHDCPVYDWKQVKLRYQVERAAIQAGKPCLKHNTKGCWKCRFDNWISI